MIVTRRRPKKRNLAPILLPLAAIAALALALAWPPSHKVIVDGPLRPLWNVTGSVTTQVSRPFSFAAQQQQIADKNRDLRARDAALETNRKAQEAKDARISALQSQVTALAPAARDRGLCAGRLAAGNDRVMDLHRSNGQIRALCLGRHARGKVDPEVEERPSRSRCDQRDCAGNCRQLGACRLHEDPGSNPVKRRFLK